LLFKFLMGPSVVVVGDVFLEHAPEMRPAENQQMI
jgi:hypothetical protein